MARYLTTVPTNLGFYNLGTVESYPTGGTGPTAYGPTSYYGSDPLPPAPGDSINTAIDLGSFTATNRTITLNNTHGGLSRRQSTFYKLRLPKSRSIQFTQNFSEFAYTQNTNKNTLLAFYRVQDGTHRVELPINDDGYVYLSTGIDQDDYEPNLNDFPSTALEPGEYIFVITNDIRYLETTYSISMAVSVLDWRYVAESVEEYLNFTSLTSPVEEIFDFGSVAR